MKTAAASTRFKHFADDVEALLQKYFPARQMLEFPPTPTNLFYLQYLSIDATYLLMRGRSVLYAGVSCDVGSRIRRHCTAGPAAGSPQKIGSRATRIIIVPLDYWEEAAQLESQFINDLRPKYNKNIPPLDYFHIYGEEGKSKKVRADLAALARAIEKKLKMKRA